MVIGIVRIEVAELEEVLLVEAVEVRTSIADLHLSASDSCIKTD